MLASAHGPGARAQPDGLEHRVPPRPRRVGPNPTRRDRKVVHIAASPAPGCRKADHFAASRGVGGVRTGAERDGLAWVAPRVGTGRAGLAWRDGVAHGSSGPAGLA